MSNATSSKRVVAITGAAGALGSSFTRCLAEAGYRVYMLVRTVAKAEGLLADLSAQGLDVHCIGCDVLDEARMQAAAEQIVAENGRVDVLVNCAGGNQAGATVMPEGSVFELSTEALRKVVDLNLMGTIIPTLAFAKSMSERKRGCFINMSSMAASQPLTRVIGYSAAKAAIDNFTRWMAVELATKYGEGMRVNAIAPGFFIGEQNRDLLLKADGSLTSRGQTIISQTPAGRFGKPEELLSTLLYLCDPASSFVNGIVIPVDGGFSAFSGV